MAGPIRDDWYNRPGIGEYGAWRVHGSHDGFDTYCRPYATIYGTSEGGTVIGKGYAAGGWGHWVDVHYPKVGSRPAYTQRDCHMAEATSLAKGADVGLSTALGRVGQTGNAKGIRWWHLGAWLWHVHSEVYIAAFVVFKKRTNPLGVWGVTTAGGTGIPISPEEEEELENDMRIIYNTENSEEATRRALVGEHTFKVITAAESVVLQHSGLKTHSVTSAEWVEVLIGTVENRARLAESNGQRRRVLYNTDNKNDATRRAVAGPGVFRTVTPDESTGERRVWGAPVNVNQAQWDAEKAAALAPGSVGAPVVSPADLAAIAADVATRLKPTIEAIKPPSAESIVQRIRDFWSTGK